MKTPPDDLAERLLARTDWLLAETTPRFDDVARAVGVSRASLYYYFSGQDDLTAFLLARHAQDAASHVASRVDPDAGPTDRLRQMVRAMAGFLGDHPAVCGGLLRATGRGMGEVLAINDAAVGQPLRAALHACRDAGVARFEDVEVAADAATGALLVAVLGRHGRGEDPAEERALDELAEGVASGLLLS